MCCKRKIANILFSKDDYSSTTRQILSGWKRHHFNITGTVPLSLNSRVSRVCLESPRIPAFGEKLDIYQSFAVSSKFQLLVLTSEGQTNPTTPRVLVLLFLLDHSTSPASFQSATFPWASHIVWWNHKIMCTMHIVWGNHKIRIYLGPELLLIGYMEMLKPKIYTRCCSKGLCCSKI